MGKNNLKAEFYDFSKVDFTLPVDYNNLSPYRRIMVRKQYVEIQKGLCFYCKKPLDGPPADKVSKKHIVRSLFPPNFFSYPIHLHHDHKTCMTIGAVHNYCNAVLFQYHNE